MSNGRVNAQGAGSGASNRLTRWSENRPSITPGLDCGRRSPANLREMLLETVQFHGNTASIAPQQPQQPLGRVLSVDGAQATVRLDGISRNHAAADVQATVGKFLAIRTSASLLVGVITKIATPSAATNPGDHAIGHLDLLGEIKRNESRAYFQRGVTEYPLIGDPADLLTHDELLLIYDISGPRTMNVGTLQQDASIGAYVNVDEMVGKHFAVFGTTGVGKSSGVALLLARFFTRAPISACSSSTRTTNTAAASTSAPRSSIRAISSCRSGCSISRRSSTSSSAAAPASRRRSRSCPTAFRSPRRPSQPGPSIA